jgi:hypothetical protein
VKVTRHNIKSLIINNTVVDIVIQVPAEVGGEIVKQYQDGIQEFFFGPTVDEILKVAPLPVVPVLEKTATETLAELKKAPLKRRVSK